MAMPSVTALASTTVCCQSNAPRCPFHTAHRDGAMRFDNYGGDAGDGYLNYQPSRLARQPMTRPATTNRPPHSTGAAARWDHRADDQDYYSQPAALFRLFSEAEKQRLFANIARSKGGASLAIQRDMIEHFNALIRPMVLASNAPSGKANPAACG